MKVTRRLRDLGMAAAILALLALVVLRIGETGGETIAGTARAADGDTLTLNGHRIRLLGVDAPEMAQACRRDGAAWNCGTAARARLGELLKRGAIECRTVGVDRYGRTLARCHAGEDDLGAVLVREGLAVAYGGYEHEEGLAQAERRGLWGAEFDRPQDWRRLNGRPQEEAHMTGASWTCGLLRWFDLD